MFVGSFIYFYFFGNALTNNGFLCWQELVFYSRRLQVR